MLAFLEFKVKHSFYRVDSDFYGPNLGNLKFGNYNEEATDDTVDTI